MKRFLFLPMLALMLVSGGTVVRAAGAEDEIRGVVTDREGSPVEGVVVSDGFTCCATDSRGRYRLERNDDAELVFYSLPSEYAVDVTTGNPSFYTPLDDDRARYDFTLTPLDGGAEKEFRLFCMADLFPPCIRGGVRSRGLLVEPRRRAYRHDEGRELYRRPQVERLQARLH